MHVDLDEAQWPRPDALNGFHRLLAEPRIGVGVLSELLANDSFMTGVSDEVLGWSELYQCVIRCDIIEVGYHRHPDFYVVHRGFEIGCHARPLVQFDDC